MKKKIKITGAIYEINEHLFNSIKEMKEKNVGEIKLNGRIFNLKDIELLNNTIVDELVDWSVLNPKPTELPEEKKEVSTEKATTNREKINQDIKTMLRKKNANWTPVIKDPIHREGINDVWEHLKSSLNTLEFPTIDFSWIPDSSITSHNTGRENHPVQYFTKKIDLSDMFDIHFWAEANYIYCIDCKKHTRKQIVIFNDYDSECLVKDFI